MIPEVRLDPVTGRIAIKTSLESPRTWFIFDAGGGGVYSTGERAPNKVSGWPAYTPPSI